MATNIIKAWIDGSVQEIEVEVMTSPEQEPSLEERVEILENKTIAGSGSIYTTVTLLASAWEGYEAPYSQVVTVNGVTKNTKVDLTPTAAQTVELQDEDIAFVAENDNGVVTVWSINCKPEIDYEIQATLTEVASV